MGGKHGSQTLAMTPKGPHKDKEGARTDMSDTMKKAMEAGIPGENEKQKDKE